MSDAYCECDYEMPSFIDSQKRRARKPHKCGECFRPIRVGETYEHTVGVWGGDWNTHDTCCRCLDLREYVETLVPCFCWAYGNVIDDAMQTADANHDPGSGLLFGAHRRKVLIERNPRE